MQTAKASSGQALLCELSPCSPMCLRPCSSVSLRPCSPMWTQAQLPHGDMGPAPLCGWQVGLYFLGPPALLSRKDPQRILRLSWCGSSPSASLQPLSTESLSLQSLFLGCRATCCHARPLPLSRGLRGTGCQKCSNRMF